MNKEKAYEQDAVRSNYAENYHEASTNLQIELYNAWNAQDLQAIKNIHTHSDNIQELQLMLKQNMEILKLYAAAAISDCVKLSEKYGVPTELSQSCKRKYFQQITKCGSLEELHLVHINVADELVRYSRRFSMQGYSHLTKMAIAYIHDSKFRFIYAKDVANATRTDRSYLARHFKNETSTTITQYIQIVKMELAVELIQSHVYKLAEISDMLGYSNYTYFSQIFKKHYGMSPRLFEK